MTTQERAKLLGDNPAFPFAVNKPSDIKKNMYMMGLSKREFLAGLAMQGYIVNANVDESETEYVVKVSVRFADALLEELSKTDKP